MRVLLPLTAMFVASACGDGGSGGNGRARPAAERLWVVATEGSVLSPSATLLFSDDGGAKWRTAFASEHDLRGLAFTRDGGIAVGATVGAEEFDRTPLVLVTEDGGAHWEGDALPDEIAGDTGELAETCFTGSGVAIVLGEFPTIILRRDAAGWRDVTPPSPGALTGIACHGENVWVTGTTYMHSADGGITWRDRTGPPGDPELVLVDVAFADDLHGWVLGALPVRLTPSTTLHIALAVLGTSDGGATWQELAVGEQPFGGWAGIVATCAGGPGALAGGSPFTSQEDPFAIALDADGGRRLGLPDGFDRVAAVAVSPR